MSQPWYNEVINKMAANNQNQANRPPVIGPHSFIGLTSMGIEKSNSPNLEGDLGELISTLRADPICQISEVARLTGIAEKHIIDLVRTNRVYIQVKSVEG